MRTSASSLKQYTLIDLIPLEKLQTLQDAFALANQVASTLTDPDGIPITRPSNYCAVCTLIRATEKGLQNCILSGKELGIIARDRQQPVHKKCCGIGFTDAAAPVIVEGTHLANWVIGQYYTREVDERRVKGYALEIGAEPEKMLEAFRTMPKISRAEFERKLEFLEIMANELSLMGYLHIVQREQMAELTQIRARLEEHQRQLEERVRQRTRELEVTNSLLQEEIFQKSVIQQQQARLITAIQSADESIIITSADGKITFVNPSFERLTGYTAQEAIGRNPKILKSGHHDGAFYSDLWQTITSGRTWRGRFVNRRKDGTIYQEESTVSPVLDETGQILNYVAVKRDITKECRLQAQLKQAQRLETIGTLAAGIAHEINTPVQYVLSNTHFLGGVLKDLAEMQGLYGQLVTAASSTCAPQVEMITSRAAEVDLDFIFKESQNAVEQSLSGLEQVTRIVRALKEFADPGAATMQQEDLNELITATVEVSRNVWESVAEMSLNLDPSLPAVKLYAGRFKQIMLDMLINAAHALIEKYGVQPQQKGHITVTTRVSDSQVELLIADSGAGIPDSIISRIFDPFFTTKGVGQGEGQSLAIAYKTIVEQHHGTIDVASKPSEGTTFTIRLPLG